MRYFKTAIPNTKLLLSNGRYMHWDKVDDSTGIAQTDDPFMVKEMESAILREVGGVSEIFETEYKEFKKKQEETQSLPPWREEFGPGALYQAVHRRQHENAVAAEKPKMETVEVPATTRATARTPLKVDRPRSIKR